MGKYFKKREENLEFKKLLKCSKLCFLPLQSLPLRPGSNKTTTNRRSLAPTVSTTNTMAINRARMVMERAKRESMHIIPTERQATRVRDITSGLTMLGTNGAQTTTGTPRKPLITSGATTRARST